MVSNRILTFVLSSFLSLGVCAAQQAGGSPAGQPPTPEELDKLLAPIALYPDALIGQILTCAESPFQVTALSQWLTAHSDLKGSEIQEAAQKEGFDPSFIALAAFPQTVEMMAKRPDWTKQLGQVFQSHRKSVFESVQRLRKQAQEVGNLKSSEQQDVKTETTDGGKQIIVIQPANPQIIYVPQYDPQVVYTTPPPPASTSTTVVTQSKGPSAAAVGVIAFTAGVVIGASTSNNYYYGPYAWRGGARMYDDAWDDYYDHRKDRAEDYYEHREDLSDNRQEGASERQDNRNENLGDRQTSRNENVEQRQGNRQESSAQGQSTASLNQTSRQTTSSQNQANREASAASAQTSRTSPSSYSSRGRSQSTANSSAGAFSGYGSGSKERVASSRGRKSVSSSKSSRRRP